MALRNAEYTTGVCAESAIDSPLKPRKMEIDDKLKEELHLHTLAMEEQQKTRARLLGESDYFDRIIEMNTEAERRKLAAMMMQTLIADPRISREEPYSRIASEAVEAADALIAELNKMKNGK